jgi:serine/threonine-protein kinase
MVSPGMTLGGRYRLDERIASGGMGDVWRGTDEVLGRTVAIKIMLPALLQEPGFAERFRAEACTMATINHPGVVDVYDYDSEQGTAFLVMEYVEGDPLSRTLGRVRRLTPARTMALIAQAADALHAAHENGIVHRDVKPGNLLVRPNGTLVLTDFGIARSAGAAQLTQAGSVLGTASYLSPEQATGRTATPLSDVYALGVVAYQCLAGRRPFEGDSPVEIAMRQVRDAPPPLPGDIPPAVRQVVERALAKDPAARYPTAAAMAQAARRAAASVNAPVPTSGGPAGAPVSPAFGGSPGWAEGGPRPGGTRVMPRTANPTTAAAPRQGQYARASAAVPAAAPTTYGYATPTPSTSPEPRERSGSAAPWAVLAVVIVVLFGVGVGWLVLRDQGNNQTAGLPAPATTSATATPSATSRPPAAMTKPSKPQQTTEAPVVPPATHAIECARLIGKDVDSVRQQLENDNYTVKLSNDQPGGRKGRVATVDPCGQRPEGTEVTVHVFTGNDAKTPAAGGSCSPTGPDNVASCPPQR